MKRWFIVTTYSGFENSVKQDLERRTVSMEMTDSIYQVLVPEQIVEVTDKKGKKKQKVIKLFPGYVFVEMEVEDEMDEKTWFMVRNTPKVTGFLGSSGGGTKPVPVPRDEMDGILRTLGLLEETKLDVAVGDKVSFTGKSFYINYTGVIVSINEEKKTAIVNISSGDRVTPIEEELIYIKKI